MRILVADDDPVTRGMVVATLEYWGYEPLHVADGPSALEALRAPGGPRLALLDWEMPGIDGPTICQELRKGDGPPDPRYLILLTGRRDTTDLARGLEAGADDYVTKPYAPVELRARINVGSRMLVLHEQLRDRQRSEGAMEMAGAVCHELNQPLQVVKGWSEVLLSDLDPDDPNARALERIKEAVERIGTLTRKLMGLTHYKTKDYMAGRSRIVDLDGSSASH